MKTTKAATALILAFAFFLVFLCGTAIMYKRLLITETQVWEIRALKVKDVGELVLPPKWEIMSYEKETHTIYIKRRVEKGAEWQAKPRCPQTIPRHKKSPRTIEA